MGPVAAEPPFTVQDPSPSSSSIFPRSRSPTKGDAPVALKSPSVDLKPNAHPYPIKTTSTAALARSNSVSSSPVARHHYVPPSPASSPKMDAGRRGEYRGHRYSRSLSSSEDMYTGATASPGSGSSGMQGPRALPIPPGMSHNSIASMNAAAAGISPKRWTPEQLAAHLGEAVSREAGDWVVRRGLGGRAFMRMKEEDLTALGAPPSLPPAAHALRQAVFPGQLETSSPVSSSGSELDVSPTRTRMSPTRMSPTRMSPTRMSPTRMSPAREDAEGEGEDIDDGTPSHDHGRKRRTPHIAASASPFQAKEGLFSPAEADGRFRNGRVQGMVRTFESSGSEASQSDGDGDGDGEGSPERGRGSAFRSTYRNGRDSGFRARLDGRGNGAGSPFRDDDGSADGAGTLRPLPARPGDVFASGPDELGATMRPGSYANGQGTGHGRAGDGGGEEEMTVEELLARGADADTGTHGPFGSGSGSWRRKGRRARRAEEFAAAAAAASPSPVPQADGNVSQHSTGSRPLPPEPRKRRYVTPPSGGVHAWEADEGAVGSTMKWLPAAAAVGTGAGGVFSDADADAAVHATQAQKDAERAAQEARACAEEEAAARGRARGLAVRARLTESEGELRAMVAAFQARLEEVERRVGVMEANATDAVPVPAPPRAATPPPPASTSLVQRLNPRQLLALLNPVPAAAERDDKARERAVDTVGPTTIAGLPSYVLLVGLGVCAVVLRVLVRRGLDTIRRRG